MEYLPDDAFFLSVFTGEALGAILSPRHLNVGNIQPLIPLSKANNLGSLLAAQWVRRFIIFTKPCEFRTR